MRDAARGEGSGGERGGGVRESAPFAIGVEDYRRAFALAMASWVVPEPSFGTRLKTKFAQPWVGPLLIVTVPAVAGGAAFQQLHPFYMPLLAEMILSMVVLFGAGWIASLLLILVFQAWDEGGERRRFPRQQAAWKRPQRLRMRWDTTGLMLAGEEGFSSLGWSALHAWIDAPGELVIFTAMRDPVPVPHAALTRQELDDLRRRLTEREVPAAWYPDSEDAAGLKQVFG